MCYCDIPGSRLKLKSSNKRLKKRLYKSSMIINKRSNMHYKFLKRRNERKEENEIVLIPPF